MLHFPTKSRFVLQKVSLPTFAFALNSSTALYIEDSVCFLALVICVRIDFTVAPFSNNKTQQPIADVPLTGGNTPKPNGTIQTGGNTPVPTDKTVTDMPSGDGGNNTVCAPLAPDQTSVIFNTKDGTIDIIGDNNETVETTCPPSKSWLGSDLPYYNDYSYVNELSTDEKQRMLIWAMTFGQFQGSYRAQIGGTMDLRTYVNPYTDSGSSTGMQPKHKFSEITDLAYGSKNDPKFGYNFFVKDGGRMFTENGVGYVEWKGKRYTESDLYTPCQNKMTIKNTVNEADKLNEPKCIPCQIAKECPYDKKYALTKFLLDVSLVDYWGNKDLAVKVILDSQANSNKPPYPFSGIAEQLSTASYQNADAFYKGFAEFLNGYWRNAFGANSYVKYVGSGIFEVKTNVALYAGKTFDNPCDLPPIIVLNYLNTYANKLNANDVPKGMLITGSTIGNNFDIAQDIGAISVGETTISAARNVTGTIKFVQISNDCICEQ